MLCIGLLSAVGTFDAIDVQARQLFFQFRGETKPVNPIVVVEFDDAFRKTQATYPYSIDALHKMSALIASDDPGPIVAYLHPGIFVAGNQSCIANVVFYGPEKPEWLADDCRWIQAESIAPVVGRLVPESDQLLANPELLNWSNAMPILSAKHLASGSFLPGAFADRIVVIDTIPPEFRRRVSSPFGDVSETVYNVERLSSNLDERSFVEPVIFGLLLCLLMVLFGVLTTAIRFPKVVSAVSFSGLLFVQYIAFRFEVLLPVVVPMILLAGAFLIWRFVPQVIDRSLRDVQDRLRDAVAATSARRPLHLASEDAFWGSLSKRAAARFPDVAFSIADLAPGDWWITFRSFNQMTEDDISEQRRDVRRSPYKVPFDTRDISLTKKYLVDAELKSVLVPLVHEEKFVGFWMLHVSQPERFLEQNRTQIIRVAAQLAFEISMHQLGLVSPNMLRSRTIDPNTLAQSALAAIEHLETDRQTLDELVEHSDVGLMILDLFGDVIFQNSLMTDFIGLGDREKNTIAETLASIDGRDPQKVAADIENAFNNDEQFEWVVRVAEESYALNFTPIHTSADSREHVRLLAVSCSDVSRYVRTGEDQKGLANLVGARARNALRSSKAYTTTLRSRKNTAGFDNLAAGLDVVLHDLENVFRDFQQLVDPEINIGEDQLFSVQSLVRNAMMGASKTTTIPDVRYDAPDHVVASRGQADVVQRAIRLLIVDAISFASSANEMEIGISEEARGVVVRLSIADANIPHNMLQRLLDSDPNMETGDQRLAVARDFIRANRGDLEASSNESGRLQFLVRLPKDDETI